MIDRLMEDDRLIYFLVSKFQSLDEYLVLTLISNFFKNENYDTYS
tara:strand:- start:392 stop:526 length:135 start_codon:yes stop_codon:yes gene_type:complete